MPPVLISRGPSSSERLAAPAARASPQTDCAFSGWNRIGSQPSASSAVIATFLSPRAATQIGTTERSGRVSSFSGLPRPRPWSAGSGRVKSRPSCSSGSRRRPCRTILMTSRVRPSGRCVRHAVEALDHLGARGAQAQDGAAAADVVEAGCRLQQGTRRAGEDVEDGGADLDRLGLGGQVAHQRGGVEAVGLGHPDRVEPGPLQRDDLVGASRGLPAYISCIESFMGSLLGGVGRVRVLAGRALTALRL